MNHKISHRSKLPKKTLLQTSNRIPSSHKPHKSSNLHQSNPLNLKSCQNRWSNKFKRMLSMKIFILIFLRMNKRWMMIWLMSMRKNQPCVRLLTINMGRVKLASINRFVSSREKLGRKLLLLRNWFVPVVLSKLRSLRFDIMDLIFVLYSIEFNHFLEKFRRERLKDIKRICKEYSRKHYINMITNPQCKQYNYACESFINPPPLAHHWIRFIGCEPLYRDNHLSLILYQL